MIRHAVLLFALASPVLSAAVVEDFATPPGISLFQGERRGVSATVEPRPVADKAGKPDNALVLRWAEQHSGFHELYFTAAKPLPGPGTVVLRARHSGAVPLWTLAVRVRDAAGTVFDFRSQLHLGEEWSEVRIPLVDDGSAPHWGGDGASARFSGAVALIGLAINGGDGPGTAELWLDDIAFVPPAAAAAVKP